MGRLSDVYEILGSSLGIMKKTKQTWYRPLSSAWDSHTWLGADSGVTLASHFMLVLTADYILGTDGV